MYKKMQSLRQRDLDVQGYIEDFYKLDIRVGHDEDVEEKMERYLGGLRFNIQDELSLTTPRSIEEYYKLAIRAEEKLKRRENNSGGRGNANKGRGGK